MSEDGLIDPQQTALEVARKRRDLPQVVGGDPAVERKKATIKLWREMSEKCKNTNPETCHAECEAYYLHPPCERMDKLMRGEIKDE